MTSKLCLKRSKVKLYHVIYENFLRKVIKVKTTVVWTPIWRYQMRCRLRTLIWKILLISSLILAWNFCRTRVEELRITWVPCRPHLSLFTRRTRKVAAKPPRLKSLPFRAKCPGTVALIISPTSPLTSRTIGSGPSQQSPSFPKANRLSIQVKRPRLQSSIMPLSLSRKHLNRLKQFEQASVIPSKTAFYLKTIIWASLTSQVSGSRLKDLAL